MAQRSDYVKALLSRLRSLREQSGLSAGELEQRLIIGPGWIERFESGDTVPSLEVVLAILNALGRDLGDVVEGLPRGAPGEQIERSVYAEERSDDLLVHFRYADHDAVYRLPDARIRDFDEVIRTLRDRLSRLAGAGEQAQIQAIKTDAVAAAFLRAVQLWPHANPSDLWWFLIYRAYCDPYNHPAQSTFCIYADFLA